MTYSPGMAEVAPPMVGPFTFGWSAVANARAITSAPSSSNYDATNHACYYPVLVPCLCVVRRVWWANGATVSASYNLDCGVYADAGSKPGTKLVSSGSTAQGTASEVQFVDVTDTTLPPGLYWVAISCSDFSATLMSSTTGAAESAAQHFNESSFPLPATAAPVEADATRFYLCGFATTSSP